MISTRGRYALRVMIDLAENDNGSFIPLKDSAARQEISKKYLEIIVKDMVNANLIVGASGKGGGYKLCRKPNKYSVGEILELMEGTLSPVACLADEKYACDRKEKCQTLPLWEEFDTMVHDFFYGKKLTDLIK
ncbi:MAG: Rrf2 family transcriptional regulator [Lachnospiraceae bacterium]|nr:Rrf2 family transcriptional regulator [Lachnospiraceae bacterium]